MRVLVVDDHPAFRQALSVRPRDGRTTSRWRARPAEDSPRARRPSSSIPDVIIMDLSMPDLSGIDAMERIHERRPDLPVVILTAHAGRRDGARGARSRAQRVRRQGHRACATSWSCCTKPRSPTRSLGASPTPRLLLAERCLHRPSSKPLRERRVVQQRRGSPTPTSDTVVRSRRRG